MIVRIATEDQFEIADTHLEALNELDNAVVAAVESGDAELYRRTFAELIDFIRAHGELIADDDLRESDVIVPPTDTDLEEARRDFSGEGLIPDSVLPDSG